MTDHGFTEPPRDRVKVIAIVTLLIAIAIWANIINLYVSLD